MPAPTLTPSDWFSDLFAIDLHNEHQIDCDDDGVPDDDSFDRFLAVYTRNLTTLAEKGHLGAAAELLDMATSSVQTADVIPMRPELQLWLANFLLRARTHQTATVAAVLAPRPGGGRRPVHDVFGTFLIVRVKLFAAGKVSVLIDRGEHLKKVFGDVADWLNSSAELRRMLPDQPFTEPIVRRWYYEVRQWLDEHCRDGKLENVHRLF